MERHYRGTPFPAVDRHGGDYLLTPLFRADAPGHPPRHPTFAPGDCVGLLTADGRSAERTGKGRYRLLAATASGETELFSDDPHAT